MPPKKGPETEALPEPPPKAAVIDPAQRSSSTKDRLDSVMSRFEKFDVEMKVGTRQRREKDEFKVFTMCARGVPSCCGGFTSFKRLVSISLP